eukprot:CAMPEP_0206408084 /NCGR_PEP_ID=MMETSP0294-20121207/30911_1 /ASSEMBLY_ACC=CAM_ASM_000327 /TAXON_ID=39354 /ORGANISM="Heterosigma akashiwo, Strain CCMP2393" /LENGTH=294 /DNA_ID=CAMNT_0053867421 /DNA_START=216 /DNA_END=1100 /DNA_ORIENTATION=-
MSRSSALFLTGSKRLVPQRRRTACKMSTSDENGPEYNDDVPDIGTEIDLATLERMFQLPAHPDPALNPQSFLVAESSSASTQLDEIGQNFDAEQGHAIDDDVPKIDNVYDIQSLERTFKHTPSADVDELELHKVSQKKQAQKLRSMEMMWAIRHPRRAGHAIDDDVPKIDNVYDIQSLERTFKHTPSADVDELELHKVSQKKQAQKLRSMEMMWAMEAYSDAAPEDCCKPCGDCAGSGHHKCGYCKGNGKMMFGDLSLSIKGRDGKVAACPKCHGNKVISCRSCAGKGQIAKWL